MVYLELHVREIRVPNIKRIGRRLVPRSETIGQCVAGASEREVHPDCAIGRPAIALRHVTIGGGDNQQEERDCAAESFEIHGGSNAMGVKG